MPPEGGEAARAFSNALAEEHPSCAKHIDMTMQVCRSIGLCRKRSK